MLGSLWFLMTWVQRVFLGQRKANCLFEIQISYRDYQVSSTSAFLYLIWVYNPCLNCCSCILCAHRTSLCLRLIAIKTSDLNFICSIIIAIKTFKRKPLFPHLSYIPMLFSEICHAELHLFYTLNN